MKKAIFVTAAVLFILGAAPAAQAGNWIHDGTGWWYQYDNGQWPADRILSIDNERYYFGDDGYMRTGWQYKDCYWYLFADSGQMLTGWQYTGGNWYFLDSDGRMQTGWLDQGNKRYYLENDGAMKTGQFEADGYWFRTDDSGALFRDVTLTGTGGDSVYYDKEGIRRTYNSTSARWEATASLQETILEIQEELRDELEDEGEFFDFEDKAEQYLKPLMSEADYKAYMKEMRQMYGDW